MKSLQARFNKMEKKNPFYSTYINFAEAITDQNFTRKSIVAWFPKLVKENDFSQTDKKHLLDHLERLTKVTEDGQK